MPILKGSKEQDKRVKKRKKMALGRGLDSLIPDSPEMVQPQETPEARKDFFLCETDLIRPNQFQPRQQFGDVELKELSDSIKSEGVIQPLLVRKADVGYELIAGERRLRASKLAGLNEVPVIVKDIDDEKMLEISIIENIQRENLNPIEEAEAYYRLIDQFGLTQEQAAERVGKSRSAVANFLRLRQLSDEIKNSILAGQLSMGHARALLSLETHQEQNMAFQEVLSKGLSVRQTEALVKQLKEDKDKPPKMPSPETTEDRQIIALSEKLSQHFGTKVEIKRRGKKGKVELEFYSDDDLNRLLDLLNPSS